MRRLLTEFRDAGGEAIEVLSAVAFARAIHRIRDPLPRVRLAGILRLRLSRARRKLMDLGDLPPLPAGVVPVWQDW